MQRHDVQKLSLLSRLRGCWSSHLYHHRRNLPYRRESFYYFPCYRPLDFCPFRCPCLVCQNCSIVFKGNPHPVQSSVLLPLPYNNSVEHLLSYLGVAYLYRNFNHVSHASFRDSFPLALVACDGNYRDRLGAAVISAYKVTADIQAPC